MGKKNALVQRNGPITNAVAVISSAGFMLVSSLIVHEKVSSYPRMVVGFSPVSWQHNAAVTLLKYS